MYSFNIVIIYVCTDEVHRDDHHHVIVTVVHICKWRNAIYTLYTASDCLVHSNTMYLGCFQKLRNIIFSKKRGKREEDNLNLLARIEEFQRKLEQKDATICRLEKTLEEKNIEKELVKVTLLRKVTALEIQMKKECLAAVTVELKLRFKVRELCEEVEQSHLDKKNYEMKLRDREAESENSFIHSFIHVQAIYNRPWDIEQVNF